MKWTIQKANEQFHQPLIELIHKAQSIHRKHFKENEVEINALVSIKTGACSEDCAYCPQSAHYPSGKVKPTRATFTEVLEFAKIAKKQGATRLCMGAAWKKPKLSDLQSICKIVVAVKQLGLETCATLGALNDEEALLLKKAGLDFYNHNIDSSPEFFTKIITSHTFQSRLDTISSAMKANIKICCGGILGMGETNTDRISMLVILANLSPQPQAIPLNKLIKIPGTPLEKTPEVDEFDFVRTVALTRILLSQSYIRLSAGRESMSDTFQALCFLAGVNSIFYGDKLLTASNTSTQKDDTFLKRMGIYKKPIRPLPS